MKVLIAATVLVFVIALSHSQVLPDPTEEQIQCFVNGAQAQATEFVHVCGDFLSQNISDPAVICDSRECYNLLVQLFSSCGYNDYGSLCDGVEIPTGGTIRVPITAFPTDGIPDDPFAVLNLTPEEYACLDVQFASFGPRVSAYIVACSALDPSRDPIRELCSNGDCRQAFGDILMDCDYDRERLDSVCSGVPIGVPATPIPDDGDVFAGLGIQAPSAEQELCLAAQFEARATEASVACSDLLSEDTPVDEEPTSQDMFEGLQEFCNDGDCRRFYQEIFGACNYNVLGTLCGGSIKVYAVPLLVFVSVLLSVVF